MPKPTNPLFYEFDDYRVDAERRLLFRKGEQIPLTPKVFDTLLVFLENCGEVLDKDRLMRELWSDSFVEESNITQNVAVLRKTLGERSKENRFIVTIPGRGYRFVADVTRTNGDAAPEPLEFVPDKNRVQVAGNLLKLVRPSEASADAALAAKELVEEVPAVSVKVNTDTRKNGVNGNSAAVRVRTSRSRLYIAGAIGGAVILAAIGVYLYSNRNTPTTIADTARIAVLPLKPVNVEHRDTAIEFALAESLILKLSESKNFSVMRLSAVRKFVEIDNDPLESGRELNVDYVLASNYQVSDNRMRVTSQLLNVRTGETEQTFKTEADSGDVFALQDVISNEIGNAVFARFGRPATTFAVKRGTENEEAYNLYHEGLYLFDKAGRENSAKAAEILGRAVELDPDFAEAWAVRAGAMCQFGHYGGGIPDEVFKIAEPMLEKALALDGNNAVALTVRGTINRDYHWNFPQAYEDLQRAIDIDPIGSDDPYRILAGLYYRDGKFAEAIEAQKKANDLDPTNLGGKWFLGTYLVAVGRADEGVALLRRLIEMDESFTPAYDSLWRIYHAIGDEAKAYEYFIKTKEVSRGGRDLIDKYKSAYQNSGWTGVLRAEFDLRRSKDPQGEYSSSKYSIAVLAAQVGEKDLAFQYLEEALKFRLIGISYVKVDPMLNGIRDDPRYGDLLKRTGL